MSHALPLKPSTGGQMLRMVNPLSQHQCMPLHLSSPVMHIGLEPGCISRVLSRWPPFPGGHLAWKPKARITSHLSAFLGFSSRKICSNWRQNGQGRAISTAQKMYFLRTGHKDQDTPRQLVLALTGTLVWIITLRRCWTFGQQ